MQLISVNELMVCQVSERDKKHSIITMPNLWSQWAMELTEVSQSGRKMPKIETLNCDFNIELHVSH
jgi:hypothetical protein